MDSFKTQFNHIKQNTFLKIIYFVLPLLFGVILYSIFYIGLPRELPVGVIDDDHSSLGEELEFNLNATSTIDIIEHYTSIHAAKSDLSTGKIYGLIVIPKGLEANIKRGIKTTIPFYYNAQFVLIGKTLESVFLEVNMAMNAKANLAKELAKSSNLKKALSQALPIVPKIYALYNANNDYSQFLLTLILPCMWQILVALGMINLLEKVEKSSEVIAGFLINLGVFLLWGMAMLCFFDLLGYPMSGSYGVLFFGSIVLIASISGVVICVQSILKNITKTVSVITAYTAPGLAFAGVTYPQNGMDGFGLFWSYILPISHFMKLYLQQANYGIETIYSLKIIAGMLPFLLFLPLGVLIYRIREQK